MNGPADSRGFKLAAEPANDLVNLGHALVGHVVLGTSDVAGGEFLLHWLVCELTGVFV